MQRGNYKTYSGIDRERIVTLAEDGGDWDTLAATLNVNKKTAYSWVNSGRSKGDQRGGKKPRKLTTNQVDEICLEIEADNQLTLQQLSDKCFLKFGIRLSPSSMHNYLKGKLISVKKYHVEPSAMNNNMNKEKRKEYVERLTSFMREEKQIIWMDETNFNLFCRRSQARSRIGERAVIMRPTSRGKNVHVIGAITASGVLKWDRMRGSFTANKAKDWVISMMEKLPPYLQPENTVLVIDNAPCHSTIDECEALFSGFTVLRLAPYSPALNPIKNIWSKVKSFVKAQMRIPNVTPPGIGEQKLQYVEEKIDAAMGEISPQDCINCSQHVQGLYSLALWKQDMPCGR